LGALGDVELVHARHIRATIKNSGGTLPEVLKLEEPIKDVKRRLKTPKALPKS
jgi:hypothetical protein